MSNRVENLREAIGKVVESMRKIQRKPNMPEDRVLQLVREMTPVDVRNVTQDLDLRKAYLEVITSSNAEIAEARRG